MANVVTLRAFTSYYLCTYTDFKKDTNCFQIYKSLYLYSFDLLSLPQKLVSIPLKSKTTIHLKIYSWLWFSIQHIIQICYISKHKFSSSWVKMLNIISSPYLYPINFNRNFILKTNQFLCILEVNLHNRTTFNLATFSGCLFIIFCIWILIEYQFNKM